MQRQQTGGRTRALFFLVGSLLLAAFAAAIVFSIIKKNQDMIKEASKAPETVPVVVAVRDLYMGLPITPDDVAVRELVPEMVPQDATFPALADVLGRTPRERILTNEMIREERLARPDAGIGLNAIVTPGKRAMTIATNTETAVAGLLQAGNYVDIIVTIKPEDPSVKDAVWVTETILQGIKVLAVGSTLSGNGERGESATTGASNADGTKKSSSSSSSKNDPMRKALKPSITLEVTPEEAEKLALASSRGEITVVLRSDIDILQIDSHGVTTAKELIGFRAEVPAEPNPIPRRKDPLPVEAKAPPQRAEVIQGGATTEIVFGEDGSKTESSTKTTRKK